MPKKETWRDTKIRNAYQRDTKRKEYLSKEALHNMKNAVTKCNDSLQLDPSKIFSYISAQGIFVMIYLEVYV